MQNQKFFISHLCNTIQGDFSLPENAHKTGKTLPEGDNIVVFSSIVSQNYKAGCRKISAFFIWLGVRVGGSFGWKPSKNNF